MHVGIEMVPLTKQPNDVVACEVGIANQRPYRAWVSLLAAESARLPYSIFQPTEKRPDVDAREK
jgi:hypothetical protein